MRNRIGFFSLAVLAAAVLAAAPAMAQAGDPAPATSCTTSNGWAVSTTGLQYVTSGSSTFTQVTYNVAGNGTPDHVATFVRAEAGPVVNASGSWGQTSPCGGDSVLGVAAGAVCHERIVRFNNQATKGSAFTLTVNGRRKPLATSVVVKKGSSQGGCAIVGFGLLDTNGGDACVSSCGNFNEYQSVLKVETFKFKGCEVRFTFDTNTGQVLLFEKVLENSAPSCEINGAQGDSVVNLTIAGPPSSGLQGTDTFVKFGEAWVGSGDGSCTTRIVGGRYYTVCQ